MSNRTAHIGTLYGFGRLLDLVTLELLDPSTSCALALYLAADRKYCPVRTSARVGLFEGNDIAFLILIQEKLRRHLSPPDTCNDSGIAAKVLKTDNIGITVPAENIHDRFLLPVSVFHSQDTTALEVLDADPA